MVEAIIFACILNPAKYQVTENCKLDTRVISYEEEDVTQQRCMQYMVISYLPQWAAENPKYNIQRWTCKITTKDSKKVQDI